MLIRGLSDDCFDSTCPCGYRGFGCDLYEANLAGCSDVGAAAEFFGKAADVDDAYDVTVFVAEEGDDVFGFVVEGGFEPVAFSVF